MTEPADLSLPEAAAMLRSGTLTSRALTEAVLERISARNPRLRAFTHITTDALEQADRADALLAEGNAGALCGLPVAVKAWANMLVAGRPSLSFTSISCNMAL